MTDSCDPRRDDHEVRNHEQEFSRTDPDRPPEIRSHHLQKLAVIYLRQSTEDQVRHHTGSTESQRALGELAVKWGWPSHLIKIIDEDLGLSGTSADERKGFQQLLAMMERNEVGIVIVREVSRLSRDPLDAERVLKAAIRGGVLIALSGRVFDPASSDVPELFGLRIQQLLAWFENENRARMFRAAKEAKVRQGHAVARPPIGYVVAVRGKWVKDPDSKVREAIGRIFDLYLQLRSTRKVARYLREHNLLFPRRARGEIRWSPIADMTVADILTNPNYTGDYVYRRHKVTRPTENRPGRCERRPRSDWIVYPNHHDTYVSRDEWETIQGLLAAHRPAVRPPIGKGRALLQGLVWCAHCDRRMKTAYHARSPKGRIPQYLCGTNQFGIRPHKLCCSALLIDRAVVQDVLAALCPPAIDAALAAMEEAKAEHDTIQRTHARLFEHAQDEVAQARRRYQHADPAHPMVKAQLEAEFEATLQRLAELKRELANSAPRPAIRVTADEAAELVKLAADREQLWNAPTTTNEDRKLLLQTVISRVVVHAYTDEHVDIEILCAGGLRETRRIFRPKAVARRVESLAEADQSPHQIARILRSDGVTNATGRPISDQWVLKLVRPGLRRKAARIPALRLIRQLLIERRPRREILEILRAREPASPGGEWTAAKLCNAIHSLRLGRWADEIPPLPADVPVDSSTRVPLHAIEVMLRGRETGRTWPVIAEDLNARGFRPPRATAFSAGQVRALFHSLRRQDLLTGIRGMSRDRTDGGPSDARDRSGSQR